MRILMLGNSLTTANGLPDALAGRLGAEVTVHARGGARLAEHLNPATGLGARTIPALSSPGWDYIVLQEMSNAPVKNPTRYLLAAEALCSRARDASAQPVIYATWSYAPDCPKLEKLGMSNATMHDQLHGAFLKAAEEGKALLADVGTAFFRHPERNSLYAPDGVHPSAAGTALAADCLAAVLRDAASSPADDTARERETPYYVYLLRCEDGSFYTGITTDLQRRFQEHREGGPKAARYTRTHPVIEIAASWPMPGRSEASKVEARVKRLKHSEKAQLAQEPDRLGPLLAP